MPVSYLKNIRQFFQRFRSLFKKKSNSAKSSLSDFVFSIIGCYPTNIFVYEEAFTHPSFQKKDEQGNPINYERLEFLGDAILGMVIAEYFYKKTPNKKEGELTQMRSKIVNRNYLNRVGESLQLEKHLIKSPNQLVGQNIIGNLLEAIIAAIYLDKGLELTRKFILEKVIISDDHVKKLENEIVSYRSYLLEWSQNSKKELEFKVFEEENANNFTIFVCEIYLNKQMLSKGREVSKKKAVEKASKRAFYGLKKEN